MKKIIPPKKDKKNVPSWLILLGVGGGIIFLIIIGLIIVISLSQNTGTLNPTIEQPPIKLDNKPAKEPVQQLNLNFIPKEIDNILRGTSNTGGAEGPFFLIVLFVPLAFAAMVLVRMMSDYR